MEALTLTFTTFLKICARKTLGKIGELRTFMQPGGYDFYKVFKKLAVARAEGAIDLAKAKIVVEKIKQTPERTHTLEAITKFDKWCSGKKLKCKTPPQAMFKSPSGLLKIRLTPELAFVNESGETYVLYLWNLSTPELKNELAGEGLRLLVRELKPNGKYKLGIFDLRKNVIVPETVIKPASDKQLTYDLMLIEEIWKDLNDPSISVDETIAHISLLKLPTAPAPSH